MSNDKNRNTLRERLNNRFANMDSLGYLSLLGTLTGLLAGLVIVTFRLLYEGVQASFLPDGDVENYEALAWWIRLSLPILGGLLIGLLFQAVAKTSRPVGIVHVMERLAYHQGQLPFINGLMQFCGAAISIISGHSVGREGPAIHLGATSGSQLGSFLHLPNNSTRTLVACGVAAAIGASFNTPLAGVIFSMEVVLMEYTLIGFIPVILAAVAATALSRVFFGAEPAFMLPPLQLGSLYDLPYVILSGIVIGCLAALFIRLLLFFSRRATKRPLWQRTTLAGLIVGLCAVAMPAVMGIGYDTVNATMAGELGIALLVAIVVFKLLATSAGLGLGIPGGLIGPTLVIGAAAGGAIGAAVALLSPDSTSSPALYAMLGMGAMMGATLQAPLAALTALLELTANPNIILPGMLAIVTANLVNSQFFGNESVFIQLMRARGLDYHHNPVAQSLRRLSVAKAMDREIVQSDIILTPFEADTLLRQHPHWIVISEAKLLLPPADLAQHLASTLDATIDLRAIPALRRQAITIDLRATLQEALDRLTESPADALMVCDRRASDEQQVLGVITREDIEEHYRYPGPPSDPDKK